MESINNFCEQELYNQIIANIPIFCMDLVIKNTNGEVLLIKRKQNPAKNQWWTVGGRFLKGESLSGGAIRKVKEETKLDSKFIKVLDLLNMYFEKQEEMLCDIHTPSLIIEMKVDNISNINIDNNHYDYMWIKNNSKDYHVYIQQMLEKAGLKYE